MNFKEINLDTGRRHYSYPSIEQFRNVIYNVNHRSTYVGKDENGDPIYDETRIKPKLKFIGTTKLHGTNAAIVFDKKNDVVYYQSRERVLTPMQDNAGFAAYMASIQPQLEELTCFWSGDEDIMVVYGEWCGGNIQKGVAINGLDKMFVIFDVCFINPETNERGWMNSGVVKMLTGDILPKGIYNIYDYPTWEIEIDFAFPQLSQNELSDLTIKVEEACPVGKAFGNDGVGEGIVWKCITEGYNDNSGFWMKVKGEKHANSKVKTLAPVNTERLSNIKEFVETYVTENRCEQSIQKLREAGKPLTRVSLGDYLKWIVGDIMKEEMDTILANGFEMKELGSPISNKAREWFFKNELNF